jgi:hypothetical protein
MRNLNSQFLVKFKTGLLKGGGMTIHKGLLEIVVRALPQNFFDWLGHFVSNFLYICTVSHLQHSEQ